MKIVDIVSESTNEGVMDALVKGGAWLLGKGGRAQAMEKLADAMVSRGTTLTAREAEAIVGKELAKDSKLLADAEQMALKKIADAKYAANVAAIRSQLSKLTGTIEGFRKWTMYTAIGVMFAAPLLTYYNNMQAAQKLLDTGKATAEDFEKYHQREMSVLIGKWAAVFAAGAFAKLPAGAVAWIFGKLGLTSIASFLSRWVGTGSAIALMAVVSHPDVAQEIANTMAGNIFGKAVGYLGVKGENFLLGLISDKLKYGQQDGKTSTDGQDSGQGGKQDTNAAQDIGSSSQGPSGSTSSPASSSSSQYDRPLFKGFK